MKKFLFYCFCGALLGIFYACKPFLERRVKLITLPIEEKNDSTLILKAHLIDYNPRKPIKAFGFVLAKEDSTQLYSFANKIYTQHPDSVYLEYLTLHYLDTSLLVKNPSPFSLKTTKVFAKSYIIEEGDRVFWSNTETIELSWGSIENISASNNSISFDYVISLKNCHNWMPNVLGILEYGFFYHTQSTPSADSHIGKITYVIADDFLTSCLGQSASFTKTISVHNLQPKTKYYFRYYWKLPGQPIQYGQTFSISTL